MQENGFTQEKGHYNVPITDLGGSRTLALKARLPPDQTFRDGTTALPQG